MTNNKFLLPLILMIFLPILVFAEQIAAPYQDQELVNALKNQHIRLIVMRHGQATHNFTETMTSSRTPGVYLTDKGIVDANKSADQLLPMKIETLYVSPLFRTLQTAHIVGKKLGLPYQQMLVDDRLREQYFGDYEGRTFSEYEAYFPNPVDVYIGAVPHGESGSELFARMHDFLSQIVRTHCNTTLLVVTHGFNVVQINKMLMGNFTHVIPPGRFCIYDFIVD